MSESYADAPADDSPVPAGPATLPIGARPWPGPDRLVLRVPLGCAASVLVFPALVVAAAAVVFFFSEMRGQFRPTEFLAVLLVPALGMIAACWYGCRQF